MTKNSSVSNFFRGKAKVNDQNGNLLLLFNQKPLEHRFALALCFFKNNTDLIQ